MGVEDVADAVGSGFLAADVGHDLRHADLVRLTPELSTGVPRQGTAQVMMFWSA